MTDSFSLVLASRNVKKARELAAQLQPLGIALLDLSQFPEAPVVDETGTTFAENAELKAVETARALGQWTLADDSGIEIDALGGAPGVYSARFAGPDATDELNNQKMLAELHGLPPERRGARYVCHLVVADPQGQVRAHVHGQCRGQILEDYRGSQGFGYDPLFLIPEYHRTFGQLSLAVKTCLSHRARAFEKLLPALVALSRTA